MQQKCKKWLSLHVGKNNIKCFGCGARPVVCCNLCCLSMLRNSGVYYCLAGFLVGLRWCQGGFLAVCTCNGRNGAEIKAQIVVPDNDFHCRCRVYLKISFLQNMSRSKPPGSSQQAKRAIQK